MMLNALYAMKLYMRKI